MSSVGGKDAGHLSGDRGADSLEIRANAGWAVTTDAWWLSIAPREGQGNATLVIEARANAGFLGRNGKVTVKGCGLTHEIRVVQDGTCAMEPSTGELFFEVGAGSQSLPSVRPLPG